MLEHLLTPLHYNYMLNAIGVSAVVGGVCGMLSAFVTLKGWSLMGDALSHAVVPGVVLAYLCGWPFAVGAFVAGMLAALAMQVVKAQSKLREDAVIGIIFTSFFAFGLLLISLYPSRIALKSIIFGNILGMAATDIRQLLIIAALAMVLIAIKWRDLMLYCFDAPYARSLGLPTLGLHLLLLSLVAATAVAALQTVGACLVVAMLITPGATAFLLTSRFHHMILLAALLGTLSSAIGAYLSYFLNGATGGCIVALQAIIFVIAWLFAPQQGLWHTLRPQRRNHCNRS